MKINFMRFNFLIEHIKIRIIKKAFKIGFISMIHLIFFGLIEFDLKKNNYFYVLYK